MALWDLYNSSLPHLLSLEWSFSQDPKFKDLYNKFMDNYIHQHMVPVPDPTIPKCVYQMFYSPSRGFQK